jgi:hypothetical protein
MASFSLGIFSPTNETVMFEIIMLTGHATVDSVVERFNRGVDTIRVILTLRALLRQQKKGLGVGPR